MADPARYVSRNEMIKEADCMICTLEFGCSFIEEVAKTIAGTVKYNAKVFNTQLLLVAGTTRLSGISPVWNELAHLVDCIGQGHKVLLQVCQFL